MNIRHFIALSFALLFFGCSPLSALAAGGCGQAAEVSTNIIPSSGLCADGSNPRVLSGGVAGPDWPAGIISGDWYWWCGDTMCHAPDPYKEYKSPFASTMMESYTGDPKSPDTATVWLQWFCSSGTPKKNQTIYNDYEVVSCEEDNQLGTKGGCGWCVMSKFDIKKKSINVEADCDWQCNDWGDCTNGIRHRTCSNPSNCKGNAPSTLEECDSQELSCGKSSGAYLEEEPNEGLCNNGNMLLIVGSNPWFWLCQDEKKEKTMLCSSKKEEELLVNGSCGDMNGKTIPSLPDSGLCISGTLSPIYGNGPWIWTCNGSNGGKSVVCFSRKETELVCDDIYSPVCGEDGKTYPNECYAKRSKVVVSHIGDCAQANECGSANGVDVAKAPTEGLCTGDSPTTAVIGNDSNWTWKCGEKTCYANNPNK
ncbi:MAG: Kazal-type serine protease inhibitor [Candidatus Pacebacteria bacterium]|nr:Kazal-type serine protease inhibitor [Candidatus Paceibacterota bacterium]